MIFSFVGLKFITPQTYLHGKPWSMTMVKVNDDRFEEKIYK